MKTTDALNVLKNDLFNRNWNDVYITNDVETAYDLFLSYLKRFYDTNCPLKQWNHNAKHINERNGIKKCR